MTLPKPKHLSLLLALLPALLFACFNTHAQTSPKQVASNENTHQNASPNPNRYEASMNLPKVSALQRYPYTRRDFLSNIKLALDEGWFLRAEMYNGQFMGELLGIKGGVNIFYDEKLPKTSANSALRSVSQDKLREHLTSAAPYFDRRGSGYRGGISNTNTNTSIVAKRMSGHGFSFHHPDIYIEDLEAIFGKGWRFRPIDGVPHHRGALPIITDPFGLDRIQYLGIKDNVDYTLSIDFTAYGAARRIDIDIKEK